MFFLIDKMESVFDKKTVNQITSRIAKVNENSLPLWGKMRADQMLAHCCVPFEYVFEERNDAPAIWLRWMLRAFFKNAMVNKVPYSPNTPTAPMFIKTGQYEIAEQKSRLIQYLQRVNELGPTHFEGKKQISLGKLTAKEWDSLLYKHLDHHLRQFEV